MYNKVFGIGLSKTGTTSLNEALNILGIKSIHYPSCLPLISGDYKPSWLNENQGATDISVAFWYKQLDRSWENSKFILTTRDTRSWAKSMKSWVKTINTLESSILRWLVYGDVEFNDGYLTSYENHNKEVLHYFRNRPNDLLVIDIIGGEGWSKLCSFLDKPIPDKEFPRIKPTNKPFIKMR